MFDGYLKVWMSRWILSHYPFSWMCSRWNVTFYCGKSPLFTTIWENMLFFFQASGKQIQVIRYCVFFCLFYLPWINSWCPNPALFKKAQKLRQMAGGKTSIECHWWNISRGHRKTNSFNRVPETESIEKNASTRHKAWFWFVETSKRVGYS